MWFFKYRVAFYDDFSGDIISTGGIVIGRTFNEAVDILVGFYGEKNIENINIGCISEIQNVLEFNEKIAWESDSIIIDKEKY